MRPSLAAATAGFLLGLYLLLLAGHWAWEHRRQAEAADLIPADAIAALRMPQAGLAKEHAAALHAGKRLLALPYFRQAYLRMQVLDSLAQYSPELREWLYGKDLWVSYHRLGRHALGAVVYAELGHEPARWPELPRQWGEQAGWAFRVRRYRGHELYEWVQPKIDRPILCLSRHHNVWMASEHPELVEACIRQAEGDVPPGPDGLSLRESGDSAAAYLYVNARQVANFHEILAKNDHSGLAPIGWQARLLLDSLGWQVEAHPYIPTGKSAWEDPFGQGEATPSRLPQAVPAYAGALFKAGIRGGEGWLADLKGWAGRAGWEADDPATQALADAALGEWAWVYAPVAEGDAAQALLLRADSQAVADLLNGLPQPEPGIGILPEDCALRRLDWGEPAGQALAYCRGYALVGGSVAQLRAWKEAVAQRQTWPLALSQRPLLEPQRWAWCWQSEQAWPLLERWLALPWLSGLREQQQALLQWEAGGFFCAVPQRVQGRVQASPPPELPEQGALVANLPAPPRTPPQAMPAYGPGRAVVFQDLWNNVRMVDPEGGKRWSIQAGRPLAQPIELLDGLGNGPAAYLFPAGHALRAIDRGGRDIPGFPLPLPALPEHLAVLRRQAGEEALLAIDDALGNAYLYTQRGKPLPGWSPMRYGTPLARPLATATAGGMRFFAAMQAHTLHLNAEGGQTPEGFPIAFSELALVDMALEDGLSLGDMRARVLASRGRVMVIDGHGKIEQQLQLPANGSGDRFLLLRHRGMPSSPQWVWARLGGEYPGIAADVALFEPGGKPLAQVPSPCGEGGIPQYFDFGGQRRYLAITCPEAGKAWLYYLNGQPVLDGPLEADLPIDLAYDPNRQLLELYRHVGKQVLRLAIPAQAP
jgi:hypothetical protein